MRLTWRTVMLPGSLRVTPALWLDSGAIDLSVTDSIFDPPVPVAVYGVGVRQRERNRERERRERDKRSRALQPPRAHTVSLIGEGVIKFDPPVAANHFSVTESIFDPPCPSLHFRVRGSGFDC